MHGIGNDFVMVNGTAADIDLSEVGWQSLARAVCDRAFGIGADGLIVADKPGNEFRMRMWNPDGSESEMCGNGVRCFAWFLVDQGLADEGEIPVETLAGRLILQTLPNRYVSVEMGRARLEAEEIGMVHRIDSDHSNLQVDLDGTSVEAVPVGMGNPHLVIFVDDASKIDVESHGKRLEFHPAFPERTNVHFVQVQSRSRLLQRTWERGAGLTLACGTGACAVAVAAIRRNLCDSPVSVELPGGVLSIAVDADDNVRMTGPTETVFEGQWAGRRGEWPDDHVFRNSP